MVKKFLALYVPVLHQGYLNFFQKWRYDVEAIYIFGLEMTAELVHVEKEIRAINPDRMAALILATGFFKDVRILSRSSLPQLESQIIVTADEQISRRLIGKYFPNHEVILDNVFLRWDEKHVAKQSPVQNFRCSSNSFDRQMMQLARAESEKSSDWWRHVGAVLVKEGRVVLRAHNQHLPSEHTPYVLGDIRDFIPPGQKSEISSAMHAERVIVTQAARQGIALEGASIYLTVFPCSSCASEVAHSGIKKCYFESGHANFNGESVLNFFEVDLIYVK